jgi:hypothetical protein
MYLSPLKAFPHYSSLRGKKGLHTLLVLPFDKLAPGKPFRGKLKRCNIGTELRRVY